MVEPEGVTGPPPVVEEDEKDAKGVPLKNRFREYLRKDYGLDLDPDKFKEDQRQREAERQRLGQLENAWAQLQQQWAAQQQVPQPPISQPVPPAKGESEEELRELARIDPYEAYRRMEKRREEELRSTMGRVAQNLLGLVDQRFTTVQGQQESDRTIQDSWPEAYDANHDLFKTVQQIYWQEMSQQDRGGPYAKLAAVERAAGRLGLAPRSKRQPTSDLPNRAEDSAGQGADRESRRPAGRPEETEKLTGKEKKMADDMGISEADMLKAKIERSKGAKK